MNDWYEKQKREGQAHENMARLFDRENQRNGLIPARAPRHATQWLALAARLLPQAMLSIGPGLALGATARNALPTRVKLLNWGVNKTVQGTVIVDDVTQSVFNANQRNLGLDSVVVDFEHNTVPGTPEFERSQEPRNIAGHSILSLVPGEGIYAEGIVYTPLGQQHALNYTDVSLAPWLDKENRVVAAHSWALTHTGAAMDMNFKEAN